MFTGSLWKQYVVPGLTASTSLQTWKCAEWRGCMELMLAIPVERRETSFVGLWWKQRRLDFLWAQTLTLNICHRRLGIKGRDVHKHKRSKTALLKLFINRKLVNDFNPYKMPVKEGNFLAFTFTHVERMLIAKETIWKSKKKTPNQKRSLCETTLAIDSD